MLRFVCSGFAFALLSTSIACGDDSGGVVGEGGATSSSAATGAPATSSASSGSTSGSASSVSTGSSGSTASGSGGEGGAGAGAGGSGSGGEGGDGAGGLGGAAGTGGAGTGGAGTGGAGTGGDGSGGGDVCIDVDFEATDESAVSLGILGYVGTRSAGGGLEDDLSITIVQGAEGDYTIVDEDLEDCTTCVVLRFGCEPNTTDCELKLLADSGTVHIESVDGDLVGELIDAHFREVTIEDGVSTPVPGGETRCIESYAFDTPFTPI